MKSNGIERKMVRGGVGIGVGVGVGIGVAVAWRGVAWCGMALRRGVAWRATLIGTDTTFEDSQKAGKKRGWDMPGKGDTL